MDSLLQRRADKIKYLMSELEREVKSVNSCTYNIMQKCVLLVDKMTSREGLDSYLAQYASVYGYLSKCVNLISEFSCRVEILLIEDLAVDDDNALKGGQSDVSSEIDSGNISKAQSIKNGTVPEENDLSKRVCVGTSIVGKDSPAAKNMDNAAVCVHVKDFDCEGVKGIGCAKENMKNEHGVIGVDRNWQGSFQKQNFSASNKNKAINNPQKQPVQTFMPDSIHRYNGSGYANNIYNNNNIMNGVIHPNALPFINNFPAGVNHYQSKNGLGPYYWPHELGYFQAPAYNLPPNYAHGMPPRMPFENNARYPYPPPLPFQPGPPLKNPHNTENRIPPSFRSRDYFFNAGHNRTLPPWGWNAGSVNNFSVSRVWNGAEMKDRNFQETALHKIPPRKSSTKYVFSLLHINRKLGAEYDAKVTHIVSPGEFYVHIMCREMEAVDGLQEKLRFYVEAKRRTNSRDHFDPSLKPRAQKLMASSALGSYAIGYDKETDTWARVEILDWRLGHDDELIQVLYIDYGNSNLLSLNLTWPMDEAFLKYPLFVQKCYLPLRLSSGKQLQNEWSEDDKTVFELLIQSAEEPYQVKLEIIEHDVLHEGGAIGVKLTLPGSEVSVIDKLLEYGIPDVKEPAEDDGNGRKDAPEKLECGEKRSDSELGSFSECASLDGSEAIPGENCASGELKGSYMPPFKVGETVPVKVTCLSRVNKFFCIKDYEKAKQSDVLESLIHVLNDEGAVSEMAVLDGPPKVGDVVIGKYLEDGLWYRAKVVKSETASGFYKLLFLDYGNTEKVSAKDLRKMESKYLEFPFQMVECRLENVELSSGVEPQTAAACLFRQVEEGDITIKIKSVVDDARNVYNVEVYNKNGMNLVDELVASKYVVLSKEE